MAWKSVLPVLLALSACAPVTTFYKPGASFAQLEADSVQCEVAALRQVPVANQTIQDPPEFIPAEKVCDRNGNCRVFPAEFIPGRIRTIDANAGLRGRVTRQCMGARGYSVEEIPQCPLGTQTSAVQTRLPALTPNICALRQDNGTVVFVQAP